MNATSSSAPAPGAVTLATSAHHRILAWPRYERAIDLETLARGFGPAVAERDDVCLCLRHDPAIDIPLPDAIAAVSAELTRAVGPDPRFEVLMVDNALDAGGWSSLARAITGVILLPWSWDRQRQGPLSGLGHPLIASVEDLRRHLADAEVSAAPLLAPAPGAAAIRGGGPAVSVLLRASQDDPEALRRALDCLAAQTFRDFEVVIVNDGSAGLESLLSPHASTMAITYLRRRGGGGDTSARQAALTIARGQSIADLNAADPCPTDHLAKLVRSQKGRGPNT